MGIRYNRGYRDKFPLLPHNSLISPNSSFTRRIRQFLNRDDLLDSEPDLWAFFNDLVNMALPSDTVRRSGMQDPVRVVNRLAPTRATLAELRSALTALQSSIQVEGLDRPLARPDTRPPFVMDLELVAWELVVGPEGLPNTISEDGLDGRKDLAEAE